MDAPTTRKTVLCVDDDDALQRIVASMLASDYDVVPASTAEDALARVAAGGRFDVVLIDLDLPGMSGQDLFATLRTRHPELAGRAAFTSSAAAMAETKAVPRSFAIRYLKKPFERAELLTFLRRVMRVSEPVAR